MKPTINCRLPAPPQRDYSRLLRNTNRGHTVRPRDEMSRPQWMLTARPEKRLRKVS
jgi:hypothetical protein